MTALTTSLPYTTGVPNSTIDAINAAIDEINLAGGDGMGDRIPDNANVKDNFSDVKVGVLAWGAGAKTTDTFTTSFTADGVVLGNKLIGDGVVVASIATTTVTLTRVSTTDSQITSYIAFQKD